MVVSQASSVNGSFESLKSDRLIAIIEKNNELITSVTQQLTQLTQEFSKKIWYMDITKCLINLIFIDSFRNLSEKREQQNKAMFLKLQNWFKEALGAKQNSSRPDEPDEVSDFFLSLKNVYTLFIFYF